MYKFYRKIDENTLMGIQKYEGLQLAKFKAELDSLCIGVSKSHGWNYAAHVERWIDMSCKWNRLPLDGYTATLQIDFTDSFGNMVEIDENVCSFFENITSISFNIFRQKYRVFQNEQLESIRTEVRQFIYNLE